MSWLCSRGFNLRFHFLVGPMHRLTSGFCCHGKNCSFNAPATATHQLRLRLHMLRLHLLRLWHHHYGYSYRGFSCSAAPPATATAVHLLRLHLLRLRLLLPRLWLHLLRRSLLRLRLLLSRAAPAAATLPEVYVPERLSVKFQFSASLT